MALQVELWQRSIVRNLFPDNSFMSKAVDDSQYVQGKKVHIPNAGKASNVEVNRQSLPGTVKKRTDNEKVYDIDELTTDPVVLPNAEQVELSYDKRESLIANDRENLQEKAADNLLYKWAKGCTSVKTTGKAVAAHTVDATGKRKAFSRADLIALMNQFNAASVPHENRYLLLDSFMYGELLEDLTESDKVMLNQTVDAANGILGRLFSFNIMERSQVLRYDTGGTLKEWNKEGATTDNAAGLAWQYNCVSRALGEVQMYGDEGSPTYYGDVFSFLVRCGGSARRFDNKGIVAIIQDTTA